MPWSIRLALVLILTPWFAPGMAFAEAEVKVTFTQQPPAPEAGDNILDIKLQDEQGQALDKAEVHLNIWMPSMGTMPRMNARAKVAPQGSGVYRATYNLAMPGTWVVMISIDSGGSKQTFNYTLTTGSAGLISNGASTVHAGESSAQTQVMPVGEGRMQQIGVRFAEAKIVPITKSLRAAGLVEADNTRRTELTLRYSGYVESQFRGRVGDHVTAGTPLITVYSPELASAESEFLQSHGGDSGAALHQSTVDRLRNLGLTTADIARVKKANAVDKTVVIKAPQTGTILEVNVRDGASFSPGQSLYTIGDLSTAYVVGRVFQQDLVDLRVGQPVSLTLPEDEGRSYKGHVDLIYPSMSEGEGTGNVRVVADEPVPGLRPGLYVDLRFPINLGSHVAVPTTAILYSGLHKYVFIDRGGGKLEPKEVTTGKSSEDWTEIRSGVNAGERVAASGTFLLSSEAQLQSALPKWRSP